MCIRDRALALLNAAFDQNRQVSQAFSAKITETGEAARRMNELLSAQKYRMAGLEKRVFAGIDRKSTRLNSSHITRSRMPSSA